MLYVVLHFIYTMLLSRQHYVGFILEARRELFAASVFEKVEREGSNLVKLNLIYS